jgi:hypothetical protein
MLAAGTRLGPYEISSPIGAGAMGQVYKARDTRLGREVAIKVLHGDLVQTADRLARFEREARAVAALNHPNVLALHDLGSEAGVVYVVTELLEGETLRARLRAAGRLSPRKVLDYINQVARGLAAAHECGIVHRDLKPENLFITREGRIKILDFGLAYREEAAAGDPAATRLTTEQGMVLGTLGYIAPEQILGKPTTSRSDLFALGVIAYEALTGVQPFVRSTPAETLAATIRDDPQPLRREVPDLPASLVKVVERCLDKDPAERPASTRDLALFLEAVASEINEAAGPRKRTGQDHRVRNQIVATWCVLWLALTVAQWTYVRNMGDGAAAAVVESDLARAERLVAGVHRERLNEAALTARLVASFPELRALFATDAATLRDYLVSYQQRNPEAPQLLGISSDGTVIARTQEGDDDAIRESIGSLAAGKPAIVRAGDRFFHAALSVAEVGGTEFGRVVAMRPVDQLFAVALREVTQDEIVVIADSNVITSTVPSGRIPWRSGAEWRQSGGRADRAIDVEIGDERFAAREVPLSAEPPLGLVVLKSRSGAAAPYQRIQDGVAIIGLIGLVLVVALSVWFVRALRIA